MQQEFHSIRIVQVIKPAGKLHGVPTGLGVVMEPKIPPKGDLLSGAEPHMLGSGAMNAFSSFSEKRCQIRSSGFLSFFLGKVNERHSFSFLL